MNSDMIKKSRIVAVLGEEAAQGVSAAGEADMIELRLDLVKDPIPAIKAVRLATTKPSSLPIVSRRKAESSRAAKGIGSNFSSRPHSMQTLWISS